MSESKARVGQGERGSGASGGAGAGQAWESGSQSGRKNRNGCQSGRKRVSKRVSITYTDITNY